MTGTGGNIKKDSYTIDSAQGSAGATHLKVDPAISAEEPGKTTGGIAIVVDVSEGEEHRYRYTSYSGDDFKLFNITGLTADGSNCSATKLTDTGASFITNGVKVGDIIRNTSESAIAYVTSVLSESALRTTAVTDWTSDSYEIGTTATSYTATDTVYVPFIHTYETDGTDATPGTESALVVYSSNIPVRIRARHAGDILPYEADSAITNTGMSNNIIRTSDTIYT